MSENLKEKEKKKKKKFILMNRDKMREGKIGHVKTKTHPQFPWTHDINHIIVFAYYAFQ